MAKAAGRYSTQQSGWPIASGPNSISIPSAFCSHSLYSKTNFRSVASPQMRKNFSKHERMLFLGEPELRCVKCSGTLRQRFLRVRGKKWFKLGTLHMLCHYGLEYQVIRRCHVLNRPSVSLCSDTFHRLCRKRPEG